MAVPTTQIANPGFENRYVPRRPTEGSGEWARQDLNQKTRPTETLGHSIQTEPDTTDRTATQKLARNTDSHKMRPDYEKIEWARQDLNLRPSDYESPALTN